MVEIQNRIMSLVNAGQLESARRECLVACNKTPEDAQLWFMLSAVCGQMQDFPAAEQYCKKALDINSTVPSAFYNLAVAQRGQGKIDEAFASLEKAIHLQEDFTAALYEQGNIYLEKQDYTHAINCYRKVIDGAPEAFQAYSGMAMALQQLGEIESAVAACIESLRLNSAQQDVTLRLATLFDNQHETDDAIQYYKRAIELGYKKADVFINIGRMFASRGDHSEAESYYKQALTIEPDAIEALTNLALLYEETHNLTSALEYIKKAYQLDAEDERVIYNYANILVSLRQYTQAEILYRKVLDKNPNHVEAEVNLGNLYLLSGRANEAQETYSHACNIRPDYQDACSNMLMSLNYTYSHDDNEISDKHFAWAQQLEKDITCLQPTSSKSHDDTLLKVGYVSPDFKDHSVAYFFEDLLKYSNKQAIINYCYSDVKNKDAVTQRLETYAEHWRDVSRLDNDELARLVRQDGIDILIDLCGHVSGNRLPMFALKPAATQITYLGYPNTTGLSVMDYRIVDKNTDPAGSENLMSETPLYLEPCFLGYRPYDNSPDVAELPALKNGYITFGSFNNLAKMSDEVIDTWSKILLGTPDSRLCVKARQYADLTIKQSHIKRFNDAGIDESRLVLMAYASTTAEHLQLYNLIDIALDTFPYNGTTTTFEALWMGAPVVCLNGTRHASRVGGSILNALGANDLLAENQQQYVAIACDLATDIEKLVVLRTQLRSRLLKSSLLAGATFTQKFESVLLAVSKG